MAQTGKGYGTAVSAGSGKALSDLETICEYYGWADRTTAGEAQLDNFINQTIQILSMLAPWPEYVRIDGAQSFNRSTATITNITGNGTTVTVTAASHGFSSNDIGDVTSTTNYNTQNKKITVSDANTFTYPDTESATAETSGTFTIGDQKTLNETGIIRVGSVYRDDREAALTELSLEEWLNLKKYHASTGAPNRYALRKYTESGVHKIDMCVYPIPTTSKTLFYTYQIEPSELSNDSDTTDWPNNRVWLLADALRTRLNAKDKDSSGMALYTSEFMAKVNLAYNQSRPSFMPIIARSLRVIPAGQWSIKDIGRHNATFS